jgi:hypothetical protein
MIILSAHKDTVIDDYRLSLGKEGHFGLLDNMIGIIACYAAVYGNPSLMRMVQDGSLRVIHSNHEEFAIDDLPSVGQSDTVIVVDVASGDGMKGKDFSIENIANIPEDEIANLAESLEWEGYCIKVKMYDGTPDDEDEAWTWRKKGARVVSFIIPIDSPNDNWHGQDSSLQVNRMKKAIQGLCRVVNYIS